MKGGEQMVHGMVQIQSDRLPTMNGKSLGTVQSHEHSFDSMLTTIKNHQIDVAPEENGENVLQMQDLLHTSTLEELIGLLEEHVNMKITLPELQEGEFVLLEDLPELLREIMPMLQEDDVDSETMAMNIWTLLEQLDKAMPTLYSEIANENWGKGVHAGDQLIHIVSFLQMVAIELPKLDLTFKQEQQLEALQNILQKLGSSQIRNLQETSSLRFPNTESSRSLLLNGEAKLSNSHISEIANKSVGQATLPFGGLPKVEGLLTELEARESSRAQLLLRELQNVLKRSNFGQLNGTNRISVKLYPEHLGQLRIELLQTNGLLTARILASNAVGKEMLENQLHQLRSAFLQQNIQVERIDIAQMLDETNYLDREHAFGQQFNKEQDSDNHKSDQDEEEQKSFDQYLIEVEV